MRKFLSLNKPKLIISFLITSILFFIILSLFSILSDGISSFFYESILSVIAISIFLGIFILVFIVIYGFAFYANGNWIYNQNATLGLLNLGFKFEYVGLRSKWIFTLNSMQGEYKSFPVTVIYNLEYNNRINVILHADLDSDNLEYRKKKYHELFEKAKIEDIYVTYSGIKVMLKGKRRLLCDSDLYLKQLEKLYAFAHNQQMKPSVKRKSMIV